MEWERDTDWGYSCMGIHLNILDLCMFLTFLLMEWISHCFMLLLVGLCCSVFSVHVLTLPSFHPSMLSNTSLFSLCDKMDAWHQSKWKVAVVWVLLSVCETWQPSKWILTLSIVWFHYSRSRMARKQDFVSVLNIQQQLIDQLCSQLKRKTFWVSYKQSGQML